MNIFRKKDKTIYVDAPVVEFYIPQFYAEQELYYVAGEHTKVFCVGNIKAFANESQLNDITKIKSIPVALATFIDTSPSEVRVEETKLSKGEDIRRWIILRYYKNDKFVVDTNVIKVGKYCVTLVDMINAGKLDYIPPDCVIKALDKGQKINGINFKLPEEYLRVLVLERYRDPNNPRQKIRFADKNKVDKTVAVSPREDSMALSTFQGITFEDINTSVIVACNRQHAGIVEEETIMEKIIKGEDI